MDNVTHGHLAEQQACEFLCQKGMQFIQKNYRPAKGKGEIDLIMRDQDCIVFVEVKKRSCSQHGASIEMLSQYKQSMLRKTALAYLQEKNLLDNTPCRFDVIGIDDEKISWISNAIETNY
ncbi:MAG: YraN family protein [Gammaproteobacteria bacterium RIFCSPHIGHO2_12_FULL_41_15]|nr:MAG: YraN family protein [Gammaproteobacteria bacterium RIFCSPHIGHO2_12_FULL_41_15]